MNATSVLPLLLAVPCPCPCLALLMVTLLLQASRLWEEAHRGQATDGKTGVGERGLCLMAAWAGGERSIPNPLVFPKQLLLGQGLGQSWAAML